MITGCSERELAGGLGEYGDVGKGRFSVSPQGYPKLQKVTGFSLLSLKLIFPSTWNMSDTVQFSFVC